MLIPFSHSKLFYFDVHDVLKAPEPKHKTVCFFYSAASKKWYITLYVKFLPIAPASTIWTLFRQWLDKWMISNIQVPEKEILDRHLENWKTGKLHR